MRDVLMEMVKEDVARERRDQERETKIIDIKNVMANLKLTLVQAMDALNIPQSQRDTYASLV